jgi:hypothetical protein
MAAHAGPAAQGARFLCNFGILSQKTPMKSKTGAHFRRAALDIGMSRFAWEYRINHAGFAALR